jgi:phosphohistidine phosphatase
VRRLILLRHGKSNWDDPQLDDFARPLAPRGLRDVPEMGRRLARRNQPPDLILSSTAVRAISTARAVARELGYREDRIAEEPGLYHAPASRMLSFIRSAPGTARTLMVVGHNPGMTELAGMLGKYRLDNMPTAGMLCADFDAEAWPDIQPAEARIAWFDYPKKQPD